MAGTVRQYLESRIFTARRLGIYFLLAASSDPDIYIFYSMCTKLDRIERKAETWISIN